MTGYWTNPGEVQGNGIDDDHNGYVDDIVGWNFVRNRNKPWDYDGHGTFVTGVIAAAQHNGIGISGISSSAMIMPLKALDAFGRGYASMAAEAINYAAEHHAQIINLSLGGRTLTKVEQLAVDHARSMGAIVVVAAGNSGQSVADFSPAGLRGVITVTATDRKDRRAGFSNWGPLVDIAAPGVDVLSLRARRTDLLSLIRGVKYKRGDGILGEDQSYYRASGTSFAHAHRHGDNIGTSGSQSETHLRTGHPHGVALGARYRKLPASTIIPATVCWMPRQRFLPIRTISMKAG